MGLGYVKTENKSVLTEHRDIIAKTAKRYMQLNPTKPFVYREFDKSGFSLESSGRYKLDFDEIYPGVPDGSFAYAASVLYSEGGGTLPVSILLISPAEIYLNGRLITKTNSWDEVFCEPRGLDIELEAGENIILVKARKNVLGFGCEIGAYYPKTNMFCFYAFSSECKEAIGWSFSGVYNSDVFGGVSPESLDEIEWYPKKKEYTFKPLKSTYAVTRIRCTGGEVLPNIKANCDYILYADGKALKKNCAFMPAGEYVNISLKLIDTDSSTLFECSFGGAEICFAENIKIPGRKWLYLETEDDAARFGFDGCRLYGGDTFFVTAENTYLRPVLESALYGKISYPLGVVLYGLLRTGVVLQNNEIYEYAHNHLAMCADACSYAIYDAKKFGCALINNQIINMDALDDCGSFAAAVLEDYLKYNKDEKMTAFFEYVAEYILEKQERLKNGLFYRKQEGLFYQFTVWADDLYMSVPFMIRYAALKNDRKIIDDAANQFICIKQLLYMPEKKLISHVFSLKRGIPTNIPWGRGNGWVLFSLSELLLVLDEKHGKYKEIKDFFIELCEGFYNHRSSDGMIHQVADDLDSYAETSCSAMCAAAFARGVRLGILPLEYKTAARQIVHTIEKECIDKEGNVYGVCIGSGYSFRREYYKDELPYRTNDTHGTGIVLTAISEVMILEEDEKPE